MCFTRCCSRWLSGRAERRRWRHYDPLLVATAILGLLWNVCALATYELPKLGVDATAPWLPVAGFAALGFLPSVVVHSVLRGERQRLNRVSQVVAGAAYTVSATAALLHVYNGWSGLPVPSVLGMRVLTYTFVASVVPLAVLTRGQPDGRRALWIAALAAFTVSALHLSQMHRGDASWPVELLGHHASIPLALAILYQDYPFALADLFLKRALTLLILIAAAFVGIATFGLHAASSHSLVQSRSWRTRHPRQLVGRHSTGRAGDPSSLIVVRRYRRPSTGRTSGSFARPSLVKRRSGTQYLTCSATRAICWRLP